MSFAELISALLGWLGEFVKFVFSFVPRIRIVRFNQRGVRYRAGAEPTEVGPGITWYWPWRTEISSHWISRDCLLVSPIAVETSDGVKMSIGVSIPFRISNVVVWEVENTNPETNMAEVAQAALRDIVMEHEYKDLQARTGEESRLGGKLARRMGKDLETFGVSVIACRPTDQVRLDYAIGLFGPDRVG